MSNFSKREYNNNYNFAYYIVIRQKLEKRDKIMIRGKLKDTLNLRSYLGEFFKLSNYDW